MKSVEDAARRWARGKYGNAGLECDFDDFLDVIFFNLELLMQKAAAMEERRIRGGVWRRAIEQPIIFWSVSLDQVQERIEAKRLHEERRKERQARRRIFRSWRIIIGQLFYYKFELENKATRKTSAYFSKLKKRGFDELEAFERATGGDWNLTLGRGMERAHISRQIQICIAGRLPLKDQKNLFRSRNIDRLFTELSQL